jgi:poly(3-hydroxybutyrate) depolymerase
MLDRLGDLGSREDVARHASLCVLRELHPLMVKDSSSCARTIARMRRIALAVACALLVPSLAHADGLLTNVPRAQFVPNIPLGRIVRSPVGGGSVAAKSIDGQSGDWDNYSVRRTRLGGTTTIQAGQLVYQDWIMDDSGAAAQYVVARRDRNQPVEDALGWSKYEEADSALGEELIGDVDEPGLFDDPPLYYEKGVERYGEMGYARGTPGSADLDELRITADADNTYVFARFQTMLPSDTPVLALAIDDDPLSPPGDWGFSSGVATPGADHVLTITRDAVFIDGSAAAGAHVASNDLGEGSADNPSGFGGFIEASVPRASIPGDRWTMWAGTGVWSGDGWVAPRPDAKAQPEPDAPRVMNLAFRGGHEPLRPWMEESQAFALRRGGVTAFSQDVDLAALAGGAHEYWTLGPGYYVRAFTSRVTDGGFRLSGSPEAGSRSAQQPYGLYVPRGYDSARQSPLTLWLHWRGPGDHAAAYYVPNMVWELGERRHAIVVSPRGRGSSGWYVGDSQIDVLDALADAETFLAVDREREIVAGYSMGGWGAYMFSTMYPDRFAGALAVVGPPAIGAWFYPGPVVEPQNGRPSYFTNPMIGNARYVPTAIMHGTDDELVPVSGTTAQSLTYQSRGQPYRYFLFPGYEHFSFALMDEWRAAADYLGLMPRVHDPARVTYARLPCLDPVHWSPVYAQYARDAYWVRNIEVRDAESGAACTSQSTALDRLNRVGSVDVTSHALPRVSGTGAPVAFVGGPPDHTTPYVMTGFDPATAGPPIPTDNSFEATFSNVSSVTIEYVRAGLRGDVPLVGDITTDGDVTMFLFCGHLTLDDEDRGYTCSVSVPAGTHRIVLTA